MWRSYGCPYRQDIPSLGLSHLKAPLLQNQSGFHPEVFLVLPPLDERIVDADASKSNSPSPFPEMMRPVLSQYPTVDFYKEQEELWKFERKTCSLCPLHENRQELKVFHISFDKGSDYPTFGEFPHLLSGENQAFSHDSHPQRMVRGSWNRATVLWKRPCKVLARIASGRRHSCYL